MSTTIWVDAGIALQGREVTKSGTVVERYGGSATDDETLIRVAAERGVRVLVVSGDSYLVAGPMWEQAQELGIALAVTHTPNPMEAADLVVEHADALALLPPGTVARLLSRGVEPVS